MRSLAGLWLSGQPTSLLRNFAASPLSGADFSPSTTCRELRRRRMRRRRRGRRRWRGGQPCEARDLRGGARSGRCRRARRRRARARCRDLARPRLPKYASPSVQTKNTAARTAVVRDRKLAVPRGAEQAARAAAAEGRAHVGALAVLHQNQADHREGREHLDGEHESKMRFMYTPLRGLDGTSPRPAAMMAKNSAAFSDAPPIRPPSMSGCASSSAALAAFMLPP